MFKRRWIHPRNCQRCFFLPQCSSSAAPPCSRPSSLNGLLAPFFWRTPFLLQRLSAAPDFAFALFTTLTPVFHTDAALQVGRGGGGALCGARGAWSSTLTNCWKHVPHASATSARQLLSLRWASTYGLMESWRLLQVWRQAGCFFLRLFRLGFFSVACLIDDGCGTAATTKEPWICGADGRPTQSFGFSTRTMMNAINSFSKKNGLF